MTIRPCRPDDLTLLHDLAVHTYRETFAADNTPENLAAYLAEAFSMERLRQELNHPGSTFYFALEGTLPVGYLKVNEAPAQTELADPSSLEIERIYVLAQFHGSGWGRALLEHALARAVAGGKAYVWLGVWEKNYRALRFYEKNGFRRFGQHTFQLGDDPQVDYLLRKELFPRQAPPA